MKGSKMKKNDVMEETLGYKPDKETRLAILKAVKESGRSIQEVIGEGKTVPYMPEIAILDEDGKFLYKGQRVTASEWEQLNPLGKYGKIVIIGTQEMVELHRKLSPNANYKTKENGT